MWSDLYKLVQLPNGIYSLRSTSYAETMHPGLGPAAEAEALYVRQLKLPDRLRDHAGEFVVWDIGLGAAANALALLRDTRDLPLDLTLHSFDHSAEPLRFALANKEALGYLEGYEAHLKSLLDKNAEVGRPALRDAPPSTQCEPAAGSGLPALPIQPCSVGEEAPGNQTKIIGRSIEKNGIQFRDGPRTVRWQLHLTDFPTFLTTPAAVGLPKPHAILFDAFSPARNPEMWTLPLFTNLFRQLDPARPCALATYSRSTMIRVSLLLAGFFVGRGQPSGLKEETTVAANALKLIEHPLDSAWLQRVKKSGSAEPLTEQIYRQASLSDKTWERLQAHPQFN